MGSVSATSARVPTLDAWFDVVACSGGTQAGARPYIGKRVRVIVLVSTGKARGKREVVVFEYFSGHGGSYIDYRLETCGVRGMYAEVALQEIQEEISPGVYFLSGIVRPGASVGHKLPLIFGDARLTYLATSSYTEPPEEVYAAAEQAAATDLER